MKHKVAIDIVSTSGTILGINRDVKDVVDAIDIAFDAVNLTLAAVSQINIKDITHNRLREFSRRQGSEE